MRQSLGLASLAIGMLFIGPSCRHCISGQGEMTETSYDPGAFSSLKLMIPAKVIIEQNMTSKFRIEAQPNILKAIKTNVSKDLLIIKSEDCLEDIKGINIFISNPTINKLAIEGSGSISSQGMINTGQLELVISGSGSMELNANAGSVFCGIRGSGGVKVEGSAQKEFVRIDGSGYFHGAGMPSAESDVRINGSAVAEVFSIEKLSVEINGSGGLRYKGLPRVSSKINGSGNVSRLE